MGDAVELPVLALCRDLLFSSKISGAARLGGREARIIREPAALEGVEGRRLLVDLGLPGAIDAAAKWSGVTGKQVIGFVSHTDAETIGRAKEAGLSRVVSRGQFVQMLASFVE